MSIDTITTRQDGLTEPARTYAELVRQFYNDEIGPEEFERRVNGGGDDSLTPHIAGKTTQGEVSSNNRPRTPKTSNGHAYEHHVYGCELVDSGSYVSARRGAFPEVNGLGDRGGSGPAVTSQDRYFDGDDIIF